ERPSGASNPTIRRAGHGLAHLPGQRGPPVSCSELISGDWFLSSRQSWMQSQFMNIASINECTGHRPPSQADTDPLVAARAEALFTSAISAGSRPSPAEVNHAIRHALARYGGVRSCATEVAFAYGDHPETAASRMRWARTVVEAV